MAKTAVKEAICRHCGAEIRDGALFCYGCGKAIPGRAAVEGEKKTHEPETIINSLPAETASEAPAALQMAEPAYGETNGSLRSAASMRRRPKSVRKTDVEVTWVATQRPPTLFYIVSLVVGLSAVALIALALYLR